MRVLVTNDDGIGAEGIRWLARAAVEAGLDVVVAAPLTDSSGASASLIALSNDSQVVLERRSLEGLDGVPAYGVAAVPGFITLLAIRGAFGAAPDIVLSGVNAGLNTGHAILHSGTVGAVFTGSTLGCRGMAVSLERPSQAAVDELHWDTAAHVAAEVLPWLMEATGPIVLNVNSPNVELGELRGLRRARLASFGAVQVNLGQTDIAESGEGSVRVAVTDLEAQYEPGTDAALVADRYATVTPLRPICEAPEVDLPVTGVPGPARDGAAARR
jgi:5'-nucleotidase